jgi:hypothetical protein
LKAKKTAALIMAILMLAVMSVNALWADGSQLFRASADANPVLEWVNTDCVIVELAFTGLKANCTARVIGKPGTTKITAEAILQRINTDGSLTTIKKWSGLEAIGNEMYFDKDYYVKDGYTYRLTINARVYKGASSESVSVYDEVYCE